LQIQGAAQFKAASARLAVAGPGVKKSVAAAMRATAGPVVADIKSAVSAEDMPATASGGGRAQRQAYLLSRRKKPPSAKVAAKIAGRAGLRTSIASGVGVRSTFVGVPSVTIVASARNLPPDQRSLVRAIEKGRWAHPVFGHKNKVVQTSRPYFYPVIEAHVPEIVAAMQQAGRAYIDTLMG
jgi:hypothetical protein